jgi:hypothetical protein
MIDEDADKQAFVCVLVAWVEVDPISIRSQLRVPLAAVGSALVLNIAQAHELF